ncbi:MAG: tyrosine-type recombinase/integrase [Acutalibacteraceae bacterium]|nr:tyrosine-type recombinase/integrase [Acutalibacteraceae bacterium]
MICKNKRCRAELPDDAKFCFRCGKPQGKKKVKKKRANGTGSIYKRKDAGKDVYTACAPAKLVITPNRTAKYIQPIIGKYDDYDDAEAALGVYLQHPTDKINLTLYELHSEWVEIAYTGLDRDTKNSYNAAWYKLRTLYKIKFRELRTGQMQKVIDYYSGKHQKEGIGGKLMCDKLTGEPTMCDGLGRSSLEKIKVILTMMYGYAIQNDIVDRNYATFIKLPAKESKQRTRFTDLHLQVMQHELNNIDYIDYIYIMCYTGHRINEFLSLTRFDFIVEDGIPCLRGGNKTAAGEKKVVPLHNKILPLVERCLARQGETIFCNIETGKKLADKYFRENCYYPALEAAGLPKYTPHSCRRTLSTRMSAANVNKDDRLAIIGHTDEKVDQESYIIQEVKTLYDSINKIS